MMPIIDFLMDNLFFVMIALFFLSSIFAKKKKAEAEAEAQKNKRTQNPSSVGSVDTHSYDADVYKERFETSKPEPTVIKVREDTIMEAREKKDKLAKASLASPIYAEDVELSNAIKSSDLSNSSTSPISMNNPSANEAVQGMMWAEVFGPPRAKKPFRGGSYRK